MCGLIVAGHPAIVEQGITAMPQKFYRTEFVKTFRSTAT